MFYIESKQGKQSPSESTKKTKKNEVLPLSPTKKKVKSRISDDDDNFDNDRLYKKQNKQHNCSWSLSEEEDETLQSHKKKLKKATGKKHKRSSVSLSPIKDLSSFESGICLKILKSRNIY